MKKLSIKNKKLKLMFMMLIIASLGVMSSCENDDNNTTSSSNNSNNQNTTVTFEIWLLAGTSNIEKSNITLYECNDNGHIQNESSYYIPAKPNNTIKIATVTGNINNKIKIYSNKLKLWYSSEFSTQTNFVNNSYPFILLANGTWSNDSKHYIYLRSISNNKIKY